MTTPIRQLAALLLAAPAALMAPPLLAQEAPAHTAFGTWGVDLSTRDTSVKPGDDFQRYAAGKWLDATQIPADRPSVG
ncbi:MAG TPA: hypothetical protein VN222_11475, partial [Novosphingobium sp.]|nr:hypothetical protein [Novosphingobium sp.]